MNEDMDLMTRTRLLKLAGVLFWLALTVTLVTALLPQPPIPQSLAGSDKVQHILAFAMLSLLAAAAFPRRGFIALFLPLALLGGFIELLQMIPALHRDAAVADWIADCLAIGAVVSLCGGWRWIRGRGTQPDAS